MPNAGKRLVGFSRYALTVIQTISRTCPSRGPGKKPGRLRAEARWGKNLTYVKGIQK